MSYKFEGWLGHGPESADGAMQWGSFEPKQWQEDDVDIKITHCSICATDIHTLRSAWGNTKYPCCVGHELLGTAVRVGRNVKHVKVGDRVGVGPQSSACFRSDCTECSSGRPNYCPHAVGTYNGEYPDGIGRSQGGFGNYNRANGSFVFKIPDGVASEDAAPMLCAGSTVYTPLKKYGCGPGKKVGVVGIGGLGHFAILFAKALGADEVVALSRSSSKKEDALALGADRLVATGEDEEWAAKMDRTLDLLIITGSSADMPIDKYMAVLKTEATLVHLGAHEGGQHPAFNLITLLFKGINIAGSLCVSPADMREMLEFVAEKKVKAWVQTMPMKEANQALRDFNAGKPRYRLVLVNEDNLS